MEKVIKALSSADQLTSEAGFERWFAKVKAALLLHGKVDFAKFLRDPVSCIFVDDHDTPVQLDGFPELKEEDEPVKLKLAQVCNHLTILMSFSVCPAFARELGLPSVDTDPFDAWMTLHRHFYGRTDVNQAAAARAWADFSFPSDAPNIQKFRANFYDLVERTERVGLIHTEAQKRLRVLTALPTEYDAVRQTLSVLAQGGLLKTTKDLFDRLIEAEECREERKLPGFAGGVFGGDGSSGGGAAAGKKKGKKCTFCSKPGHTADSCWKAGKGNPPANYRKRNGGGKAKDGRRTGKAKGRDGGAACYICGQSGHVARGCPERDRVQKFLSGGSGKPAGNGGGSGALDSSEYFGFSGSAVHVSGSTSGVRGDVSGSAVHVSGSASGVRGGIASHERRWILDSGTTGHVDGGTAPGIRSNVRNSQTSFKVASGHKVVAPKTADVKIDHKYELKNVIVPERSTGANLMSVAKLCDQGYEAVFRSNGATLYHGDWRNNRVRAQFDRDPVSGLFLLNCKAPGMQADGEAQCLSVTDDVHRRFGHPGARVSKALAKAEVGEGPVPELGFCETCAESKACQVPHHRRGTEYEVMELLHTDLIGPVENSGYVLTVVERRSRATYISICRKKSVAAQSLRAIIAFLQNQTGRMTKSVQSDRGGEFLGGELQAFFAQEGIAHRLTSRGDSKSNGLAEVRNRHLQETARAMLVEAQLPPCEYWEFAVKMAAFIINRRPSTFSGGGGKSPHELLFGRVPVEKVLTFGSDVYVKKPLVGAKDRFGPNARRGILVGQVPGAEQLYEVYVPELARVVTCRDAAIREGVFTVGRPKPSKPDVAPLCPKVPDVETDGEEPAENDLEPPDFPGDEIADAKAHDENAEVQVPEVRAPPRVRKYPERLEGYVASLVDQVKVRSY